MRIKIGRQAGVLVWLVAACGSMPEQEPQTPQQAAATQVGAACVGERPDSAEVVRAALAVWGEHADYLRLQVREFERFGNPTLITLVPGRTDVLGGGGRVRVPHGGCAQVIEYFE